MGRMSQITSFNYDGLRRLTSATGPLGRLTEFFYNEQGARSRIKNGSAEIYQNFDNASRLTNQRHRSGCLDFHLGRGKPVSMTNASGTTFYYVTNFRGDVIRIMDSNSVANYSYDPWGKVLSANEDPAMVGQPLRYASNVYDTETQLYYLQARYYDPDTARFISRDPNGGDQDNPLSQNLLCVCQ
jgi:RHS repeat-associated protein